MATACAKYRSWKWISSKRRPVDTNGISLQRIADLITKHRLSDATSESQSCRIHQGQAGDISSSTSSLLPKFPKFPGNPRNPRKSQGSRDQRSPHRPGRDGGDGGERMGKHQSTISPIPFATIRQKVDCGSGRALDFQDFPFHHSKQPSLPIKDSQIFILHPPPNRNRLGKTKASNQQGLCKYHVLYCTVHYTYMDYLHQAPA